MAVLTSEEKKEIIRFMERYSNANGVPISWVKDAVSDSAQALEDWLVANEASAAAAIQAAASPHGITWTNPQLKQLSSIVFNEKYNRDRGV